MTTAHAVAQELRKLADSLDTKPDQPMYPVSVYLSHDFRGDEAKDIFVAVAPLLPRPLVKSDGYSHDKYMLTHINDSIVIVACIEKSKTCMLVEPAKPAVYECLPILSLTEDAALIEA